jgi:hypothetical protein
MPNPYLILAVFFLWAGSLFVAYGKGESNMRNEIVAAQKDAQDKAIRQHNEDVVVDMQAAAEAATKQLLADNEAKKRQLSLEREAKGAVNGKLVQITGDLDATRKALDGAKSDAQRMAAVAALGCTLSERSFGLLNAGIEAYNASAATSGVRVDAVPSAPVAPRSERGVTRKGLSAEHGLGRDVRPDARGDGRLAQAEPR